MNLWAAPGKQCVCINDNWSDVLVERFGATPPSRLPMINEILTITDVVTDDQYGAVFLLDGKVGISFAELGHDFLFSIAHFKPLITEEDDVEMFRSIAKEEGEKV